MVEDFPRGEKLIHVILANQIDNLPQSSPIFYQKIDGVLSTKNLQVTLTSQQQKHELKKKTPTAQPLCKNPPPAGRTRETPPLFATWRRPRFLRLWFPPGKCGSAWDGWPGWHVFVWMIFVRSGTKKTRVTHSGYKYITVRTRNTSGFKMSFHLGKSSICWCYVSFWGGQQIVILYLVCRVACFLS